ncbi:MAG: exosome complex exonuclease Rrp41 [Candidatus Woesearchaeota archaeon]|jgi:exosome complex component RRP41|nr:exosome complex exonuclease Rrp41 [Candidatus Woesearchaeota archaeon]MDP7180459.1 exosome complex exonuclease Rrp41 [Candidatus Woesearchaeota archaeon]MDP7457357.1 exosome complex exonuclease Rrp41 [Candidatus Woesearchaeota archaeon]
MGYDKRIDDRKVDEYRKVEAKVGVIKRADGSAYFKIGNTWAYAAVYGPRNLYPKFLQNPEKGILRCHYNMMPFSSGGDRVRPGGSRRSKEISMVTKNSLLPVLDLSEYPNSVVDVFIELPQTEAGSRCAGITAASMALADAGLLMKDLISSVSVGRVDDKLVVDLDYYEESYPDGPVADVPLAIMPGTGEITLLQMDGEVEKDDLKKLLDLGKKACMEIYEVQKKALKERYEQKQGR